METKQDAGRDFEIYWHRHLAVEEAEGVIVDLEERLEFWREELEKRRRSLARCE